MTCMQCRRCRFNPWVGNIPWKRAWQPSPAFLPGESHGQRRLVGYGPWGHKDSDMTEATEQATLGHLEYSGSHYCSELGKRETSSLKSAPLPKSWNPGYVCPTFRFPSRQKPQRCLGLSLLHYESLGTAASLSALCSQRPPGI